MYDNNKTKLGGIHYSRYIMSWVNVCKGNNKPAYFDNLFREWLEKEGCTADEIDHIVEMARCGKMELEKSAMEFLSGRV